MVIRSCLPTRLEQRHLAAAAGQRAGAETASSRERSLGFGPPPDLLVEPPSSTLVVLSAFHCEIGRAAKLKSSAPASSTLALTALQRCFRLRRNLTSACFPRLAALGVVHQLIILREFLARMDRGLGEQVLQCD